MATPIKRKTVVTDPEGNKITTKTRTTNLFGPKGASKVVTKFATPESFKKRKQVETYSAPKKEIDTSYKKGGATKMKKYESGGPTTTRSVDTNEYGSTGEVEKTKRNGNQKLKTVEISNYGSSMAKPSSTPTARIDKQKYDANGMEIGYKTKNISVDKAQRKINRISNRASAKTGGYMKTGGMVNANAKITAAKAATGRVGGVTKAISKVAVKSTSPKGRVGGISKAPKKASIKKK